CRRTPVTILTACAPSANRVCMTTAGWIGVRESCICPSSGPWICTSNVTVTTWEASRDPAPPAVRGGTAVLRADNQRGGEGGGGAGRPGADPGSTDPE